MQVDDVSVSDLDEVLALNEASVPHVNSLTRNELQWFHEHASYFRLVRHLERTAGFLIGLGPGLDYCSPNYQYFCARHEVFGYVDRVAVAPEAQRLGIASQLYEDYAATLRGFAPVMTCEVNLRPSNPGSLAYHERHGFVRAATQETEGGSKEVALMEKRL
jgi:predicted GNAT superfamily acetyltransferase